MSTPPPFQFPKPVRSTSSAGPARPRTARPTPPPAQAAGPSSVKHGGGFNMMPQVNLSFIKATTVGSTPQSAEQTQGATPGGGPGPAGRGTPGADFMSNESVRAFCEFVRKNARNRAVERAMDAEQLEQVLRHIPTEDGSMAGARLRSRRVSRHLKKIAKAEQEIAKSAAGLYAQFEREFESNLRKVGKARPPQPARFTF